MTIPDFQTLMRPILSYLADGEQRSTRNVIVAMSDEFGLTADERAELIPSGKAKSMDNRVGWSLTHLSQAGLIERPMRAQVKITSAGLEVLKSHHDRVDMTVLRTYPSYREFRERSKSKQSAVTPAADPHDGSETASPQELIDAAVAENRAAVEGEILKKALDLSPTGFEDLVIALLDAMGYGRAGSIQGTSATGDAGIDGIISQDPLGLDRIYVQAKRYTDRSVDRPRIHEFAGALLGKQGDRGVFITTSRFTPGARSEAERINARIELIDGTRLAELLIKHRVGVQSVQTVELYRLDEDFFDEL